MLELVTSAPNRGLLTSEELRAAAGVTDASQDAELTALGLRISDLIAIECRVARAGLAAPTLLQETLRERIEDCGVRSIFLSRRFVEILTVEENGTALPTSAYDVDVVGAELSRRWTDQPGYWGRPLVVTYKAGFPASDIPAALKEAAIAAVREQRSSAGRDPLLRSESVEGVGRFDYQMPRANAGGVSNLSPAVADALHAYRTFLVA